MNARPKRGVLLGAAACLTLSTSERNVPARPIRPDQGTLRVGVVPLTAEARVRVVDPTTLTVIAAIDLRTGAIARRVTVGSSPERMGWAALNATGTEH